MMDCPPVSRIVDHNKDFKTLKELDKLITLIFEVVFLACMFRTFSKPTHLSNPSLRACRNAHNAGGFENPSLLLCLSAFDFNSVFYKSVPSLSNDHLRQIFYKTYKTAQLKQGIKKIEIQTENKSIFARLNVTFIHKITNVYFTVYTQRFKSLWSVRMHQQECIIFQQE